jgi:hypothetical protein
MGARWAWDAECTACGHTYGGFSGGADPCPSCGSDNVVETTLVGQSSPDYTRLLQDMLRAEHLRISEQYSHDSHWCRVCQAIEGNCSGPEA